MVEALKNAEGILKPNEPAKEADKTLLKIALDLANAITDEDLANVVPAVVEEFKEARDEANGIYNDTSATQDKVNAALSIVKEAASLLATTLIGRDVQYLPSFLTMI